MVQAALPLCPVVQHAFYERVLGFVTPVANGRDCGMEDRALDILKRKGLLYVTGRSFNREGRAADCCFENARGGKSTWASQVLLPRLIGRFGKAHYINIQDRFQIKEINRGLSDKWELERFMNTTLQELRTLGRSSRALIIDECQWLFPNLRPGGSFSTDPALNPIKKQYWDLLANYRANGVKLVFVSYMHPQDAGLPFGVEGYPKMWMIFQAPVFEFKQLPLRP